jgi:hypothetical protein
LALNVEAAGRLGKKQDHIKSASVSMCEHLLPHIVFLSVTSHTFITPLQLPLVPTIPSSLMLPRLDHLSDVSPLFDVLLGVPSGHAGCLRHAF